MQVTSKRIVGYWHYGVLLTYASLISAMVGISLSAMGFPGWGIVCLFISGICDAFDGAVARTRKDRTDGDKLFGSQIDSLSDLVAFGVAPIMISVGLGLTQWYFIMLYCVYVLCALIRLAYYNVTEEEVIADGKKRAGYEGLPVTNITYILPPVFIVATMFTSPLLNYPYIMEILIALGFAITAVLFVLRFRVPKWNVVQVAVSIVIAVAVIVALFCIRWFVCGVHYV